MPKGYYTDYSYYGYIPWEHKYKQFENETAYKEYLEEGKHA